MQIEGNDRIGSKQQHPGWLNSARGLGSAETGPEQLSAGHVRKMVVTPDEVGAAASSQYVRAGCTI